MLTDLKIYALLQSLIFPKNAKRNPCWLMESGVGMEHQSSIKDKTEDGYMIRLQMEEKKVHHRRIFEVSNEAARLAT
jgi:hypothetical protein